MVELILKYSESPISVTLCIICLFLGLIDTQSCFESSTPSIIGFHSSTVEIFVNKQSCYIQFYGNITNLFTQTVFK